MLAFFRLLFLSFYCRGVKENLFDFLKIIQLSVAESVGSCGEALDYRAIERSHKIFRPLKMF